jgi:hypothetical protein
MTVELSFIHDPFWLYGYGMVVGFVMGIGATVVVRRFVDWWHQ